MKFYLSRTLMIILFSMATSCFFQNKSQETEDKVGVKSTDEMSNLASPSSSGPNLKAEGNQLRDMEFLLGEALGSFQLSQDFWQKGDFSNAISTLDQAYNLILQVNADGDQDLFQQKEKIRLMICKQMIEIYATQHPTARGSQKAIPLVLNRYVKQEINRFKGPEKRFFVEAYKLSGRYRPMITEALEKAGLPQELSWLPLVESGFRVKAFSSARALGLWQFIPSTGYIFGLKRDHWLDERMDPGKSTQAALSYLQDLHNIFGDWCTVLAAYNCGDARVFEVIRTQRINYLDNFWDLFEKLPPETARYVPRFIATLLIINNPDTFGFALPEPHPPLPYESAKISQKVRLKNVAKILSVSSQTIEALNPELRLKMTPPGPYDLRVPEGKGDFLLSKLNGVPASNLSQKFYTLHRVRWGETLTQLAGRYRISAQAITDLNHIKEKDYLRVGQELKIPLGGTTLSKETEGERENITPGNLKPPRYRMIRAEAL